MENTLRGNGPTNPLEGTLGKASSGAHAAVDSLAGAVDQAARRAKPAIDRVAAMAHHAVDSAADAAAPAAGWLNAQGQHLKATQKRLVEDTCSYVSAHPLKSLGIAALAGFLLSRIVK